MIDRSSPHRLLARPAIIIAAHPDDEILGLGTLLSQFRNLRAIVHVTDGAPRRGPDAADAGVNSWQEYAALRRCELQSAMQCAGVRSVPFICLNYPDQEALYRITALAQRLVLLLERFRPATVFTHGYEGGHPDHDACAAAVKFACSLLGSKRRPEILEFAGYHAGPDGGIETEHFIGRSRQVWRRPLSERQQQIKRDLLSNYRSQQRVLSQFPLRSEPIRVAPQTDFRKPPHQGKLYYENFDWGITGRRWRMMARRAFVSLGLSHGL